MKKITAIALLLAGGLLAQTPPPLPDPRELKLQAEHAFGGGTFQFIGGQLLNGTPVKGAPYSAESITQTTQTLADGSHIVNQSSSMLYRDSEGRERREESIGKLGAWSAESAPAKAIFISDPVAKVSYSLNPENRTARRMPAVSSLATTVKIGEGNARFETSTITSTAASSASIADGPTIFYRSTTLGSDKTQPKVEQLGAQVIEGVRAEGTRTTITIPAGQIGNERDINIVSERWYSPELKVTILSRHSDPRMGETVYKLTNINRAEPLHSMFEVPPDYTMAPPLAMQLAQPVPKDQDR